MRPIPAVQRLKKQPEKGTLLIGLSAMGVVTMDAEFSALVGDTDISKLLNAYFRALDDWEGGSQGLGFLPQSAVIEQTRKFRNFHPTVRLLCGIVIDDPGTSDHHVVLCRGAVKGTVLYLAHDGDSRIVFDSIGSFLKAGRRAADADGFIDDEHPDHAWVADDQTALRHLIVSLRSEPRYGDIIPVLIPSLDLADLDFLSTLVRDDDFYVAEAVCREIVVRPAPHLMPIVQLGQAHAHWMVRDASTRARERVIDCLGS